MNYVREMYVEFLYPGVLLSESSTRRCKTRDPSKVKIPKNAFGFRFFDFISTTVDVDGKKVRLESKRGNVSSLHYYGGRVYTLAELKREFPDEHTLILNVENSRNKKAICCRTGNWYLFERKDVLVKIA